MSASLVNISLAALAAWVLYLLSGAIYRLYFHPLAKFPGPKLAAVTGWYEFYHDVVRRGLFIWKIQELHDRYGPIIRINPDELHIRDSDFYEELYAPASKKRDKYANWTILAGAPTSSFATVSHSLHRLKRSALNPYFSKRAVANTEPLIWDKVERLCLRFAAAVKTKEVIRLDAAYMALTMDIITHYAYGESYNYLAEDDFKLEWKETVVGGSANGVFLRQFPWALPILKATPLSILKRLNPKAAALVSWQCMIRRQVETTLENNRQGKKAIGTIFQAVLDSDLPDEEKTADRLQDEGQTLVGAGSETTAKTLSIITFYLLQDKKKLQKLRDELSGVPLKPEGGSLLSRLEPLPYLTAVISEGLRHMHGVTTRLPRVAHEPIKYKEWEIPPHTPVSESNYFVHMDPAVFPDPLEFKPDRWIEAQEKGIRLDRYLVAFSKGSRQCVGINLAYAELYLTLATVLRRFEFENFETTVDDVRVARDFFVGVPKLDSKGIRAVVTKSLEA
ncbi:hypothetical protein VTN77DRAFT_6563 [Rasamsonia byssochlamydoides]|uniref:uncharacterized protein n=1 Tax=Rasamsonia byssochlamydoides TaxID=89139 RepID=UPI0037440FFD